MINIKYKSISTPFHHPFTTAHGLKTHQPALLIALSFNGITGFGEAPAIHYYNVTVDSMIDELVSKIEILQRYSFTEPERFWHFCHHLFPHSSFLVCALDMAYWDMYAKINRKPIYQIKSLPWENIPLTDYTIGLDTIPNMLKKIKEKPWPIYKIKCSGKDDVEIIKALRQETDAIFRIDANASWLVDEALEMLPVLAEYNIEMIEQPLAKDDWQGMKILKQETTIPLFADESCVSESDVERCCEVFDGINIKLTKCGGLTPAFRMIEKAKSLNKKVMMGCMNETEIGSYAIAQFLPLLDYVDMDGPLLLDIPELKQLKYNDGLVTLI
ncbi:MAG TPA: dipeptide epimerase [Chitinophagaceae bacterium]|nr:dipeptide epimerase [Chitinophagaceae bacterium]